MKKVDAHKIGKNSERGTPEREDPGVEICPNNSEQLLGNSQLLEALSECEKAIAVDPKMNFAHNLAGYTQVRPGGYDESMESIKSAIRISLDYFGAGENLRNARIEK